MEGKAVAKRVWQGMFTRGLIIAVRRV